MIKFSDLIFGRKEILAGNQIWNNDQADCAEVKFYPKDPKNEQWLFWILGEQNTNTIYTICERCGNTAVARKFQEDSVRHSIESIFCFHCQQYQRNGESEE
jgi:hypothetical protein